MNSHSSDLKSGCHSSHGFKKVFYLSGCGQFIEGRNINCKILDSSIDRLSMVVSDSAAMIHKRSFINLNLIRLNCRQSIAL